LIQILIPEKQHNDPPAFSCCPASPVVLLLQKPDFKIYPIVLLLQKPDCTAILLLLLSCFSRSRIKLYIEMPLYNSFETKSHDSNS
jgi:hypothetical protein